MLDTGLPTLDGLELARRIVAAAPPSVCRIIAITGYGQEGDKQRTAAAGFSAHLVKPVSVATLLAAIADD